MKIFTLYDKKAEAYFTPFFSKNENTAIRQLAYTANQEGQELHVHAEDYHLFEIGEYDEQTGKIKPVNPAHICCVLELIKFELTGKQIDLEEANKEKDKE